MASKKRLRFDLISEKWGSLTTEEEDLVKTATKGAESVRLVEDGLLIGSDDSEAPCKEMVKNGGWSNGQTQPACTSEDQPLLGGVKEKKAMSSTILGGN